MKKSLAVLLAIAILLPSLAHAGSNRSGFGLGLMVGEPSGISAKLWLKETTAVQGAVAWSTSSNSSMTLQADYVRHNFGLISISKGALPLYFGLGGRWVSRDGDDYLGVRVPIGLDWMFENSAFDVFAEIVPTVDVTPDLDLRLAGAIGGRFFF